MTQLTLADLRESLGDAPSRDQTNGELRTWLKKPIEVAPPILGDLIRADLAEALLEGVETK